MGSSILFLPPAYIVRREGNVLTRVCPSIHPSINLSIHRGEYPYPIMLCNISQNAMGQPGGYPARSSWGGTLAGLYPAWGVPCLGGTLPGGVPWLGGYPGRGGTLAEGYPGQGSTLVGGYPAWGGTLAGGYPAGRGGTQLGQHGEYLLHGGRYASCVHAGGLSCC